MSNKTKFVLATLGVIAIFILTGVVIHYGQQRKEMEDAIRACAGNMIIAQGISMDAAEQKCRGFASELQDLGLR